MEISEIDAQKKGHKQQETNLGKKAQSIRICIEILYFPPCQNAVREMKAGYIQHRDATCTEKRKRKEYQAAQEEGSKECCGWIHIASARWEEKRK